MHHIRNKLRHAKRRLRKKGTNKAKDETLTETTNQSPRDSTTTTESESISKRLWSQAYDELRESETERSIVKAYEVVLTNYLQPKAETSDGIPNMQNLVDQDHDERWRQMEKLVRDGLKKTAKDANRKEAVNDWLMMIQPLKSAVDVGIKAAPEAAIPWAGICCALEILSSPLTEPKKNRDGMAYVLTRMEWYWELWEVLLDKNWSTTATEPLRRKLENHVVYLYQKLLIYEMKSVVSYNRSRLATFFRDLPKLDDWESLINEIKDAEAILLRDCEQYNTQDMRDRLRSILSSAIAQEKLLLDTFNLHESHYAWQREERHKEKDDKCLRDLYIVDPQHVKKSILNAKGGLVHESFFWVTRDSRYKAWQDDTTGRLLWIRGDAGKGKTMLLCGIIEELEKSTPRTVFYFFCQESDPKLRSATNVLRGLIWSLVRARPQLISYLREDYDQAGESLFQDNAWQYLSDTLTRILQDSAARDCIFIIDALDECSEHMEKLIGLVSQLSTKYEPRWLVSSRNWSTIDEQLNNATINTQLSLELNSDAIANAVKTFINVKIDNLVVMKGYDQDLRTKIYDHLVENADDTFLWVALVCAELEKPDVHRFCAEAVAKEFPKGLEKLYERMMKIINDSRSMTLCKAVLALVTLAFRPIKLSEVAELDTRLGAISKDPEALPHIVRSCGSMLTIQEDQTVRIVHQSAKDYLMESPILFPMHASQQHAMMFISSMEIMQNKLHRNLYQLEDSTLLIDEITPPSTDPLEGAQYSCIYWIDHLKASYSAENKQQADRIHGLLIQFLTTKCLYWFEAMSLLRHVTETVKAVEKLKEIITTPERLVDLVEDARRWALMHRPIIDVVPLQLYDSALVFSPRESAITKNFAKEALNSINLVKSSFQQWDACLQVIPGFVFRYPWPDFSPDRTKLATIKDDNQTILIFDLFTGDQVITFPPETGTRILSVSYHPGGKYLASISTNRDIKIWDIHEQRCIQSFRPRTVVDVSVLRMGLIDPDVILPFSPNGKLLAVSGDNQTIEIWDAWGKDIQYILYNNASGETEWFGWGLNQSGTPLVLVVRFLEGQSSFQLDVWSSCGESCLSVLLDGRLIDAAVDPDGKRLAVSTPVGISIASWDPSITIQRVLDERSIGFAQDLTWSPEGGSLAITTGYDIIVWNVASNTEIDRISGHAGYASTIRYVQNNRLASKPFADHTLRIWNVNSEPGHTVIADEPIEFLNLGPNDNLAVHLENKDVEIISTTTGQKVQSFSSKHFQDRRQSQFGQDRTMATMTGTGTTKVWDLVSGNCTHTFEAKDAASEDLDASWPVSFCFCESGELITVARNVKVWNTEDGSHRGTSYTYEPARFRAIACSRDHRLALTYNNSQVAIWRQNWAEERPVLIETRGIDLAFNTKGFLAVNDWGRVSIWNSEDGTQVQIYDVPGLITAMSFDSAFEYRLNVGFGVIEIETEKEDRAGEDVKLKKDPQWSPESLRLEWTNTSAWLMKGSRRVLWVPRGYVNRGLFSIKTNRETGISTLAMVFNDYLLILRIQFPRV